MAYQIVLTDTAKRHYRTLDARWRSSIKSGMEKHLRHQPGRTSKSRIKRLREMEHPQYRLRLQDHRIFYDIAGDDVVVLAIVPKMSSEKWLNKHGVKPS